MRPSRSRKKSWPRIRPPGLPGAALLRRAAYEEMMIGWLGEVLDRIPAGADSGHDAGGT
jgi:hypothetical protein